MNTTPLIIPIQSGRQTAKVALLSAGLIAFAATASQAAVLGITDIQPTVSGNLTTSTILESFTTSAGTTSTIAGATSTANITTDPSPGGESGVRNFWGSGESEIDGGSSMTTGSGLDLAFGVNSIVTMDVSFGQEVLAAPGDGNDLFFTNIDGHDPVNITPLDSNGNPIGDFTLSIGLSDYGLTGQDREVFTENVGNGVIGPFAHTIGGVAFDLSDFSGTGTLSGVEGLRFEDSNSEFGTAVVGYNTVPEPATTGLLVGVSAMLLLVVGRRRNG